MFIAHVLDEAQGNCLAWTTLYLSVAERLELSCHAVRIPGHVFVRYDQGLNSLNIKTTAKWQSRSDRHYMKMLQRCADASVSGKPVMQSLTKREFLSMILVSRGLIHKDMENYDQAIADFTWAVELNPGYPGIYNNRGLAYAYKHDTDRAGRDWRLGAKLKAQHRSVSNCPFAR